MGKIDKKLLFPIIYVFLFLLISTIFFVLSLNFFILFFIILMAIFFLCLIGLDRIFNFPLWLIWMATIFISLHFLGSTFPINGGSLYGFLIFNFIGKPFNILQFDQIVHFFGSLMTTFFVYFIMKSKNKLIFGFDYFFIILIVCGVGAINEISEFAFFVFFNSNVGDYYNNSLDMVFNLFGALIGLFCSSRFIWKKNSI